MFDGLKILQFRELKGSTTKLKGFMNIYLPQIGMEIYDFSVFNDNGRIWFSFPSKEYVDKESGEKKWANRIRFPDKVIYNTFLASLEKAFQEFMSSNSSPSVKKAPVPEPENTFNYDDDLPF